MLVENGMFPYRSRSVIEARVIWSGSGGAWFLPLETAPKGGSPLKPSPTGAVTQICEAGASHDGFRPRRQFPANSGSDEVTRFACYIPRKPIECFVFFLLTPAAKRYIHYPRFIYNPRLVQIVVWAVHRPRRHTLALCLDRLARFVWVPVTGQKRQEGP